MLGDLRDVVLDVDLQSSQQMLSLIPSKEVRHLEITNKNARDWSSPAH